MAREGVFGRALSHAIPRPLSFLLGPAYRLFLFTIRGWESSPCPRVFFFFCVVSLPYHADNTS